MTVKKRLTLIILTFFVMVSAIHNGLAASNLNPVRQLSRYIDNGNLGELRLTIYYLSLYTLTIMPVSVDFLINDWYEQKITVCGDKLQEKIHYFNQVKGAKLLPTRKAGYVNARIYYVFETASGEKILDVVVCSTNFTLYVNGVEYEANVAFFNIIMLFLPEKTSKELGSFLAGKGLYYW